MSEEDGKNRASSAGGERLPENYYYGTFQGVANYPPPSASSAPPQSQPVFGFPQPVPPPGSSGAPPHYYPHAYQTPHGVFSQIFIYLSICASIYITFSFMLVSHNLVKVGNWF